MVKPLVLSPDTPDFFPEPFDVVVIAYGQPDLTYRCVLSVLYCEPHARVILVDNGSKEPFTDLKAFLETVPAERRHVYLRLDPNVGPYGAANAGIELVETPIFCLMCNDAVALPGSLRSLVKACTEEFPYVGASEINAPRFDAAVATAVTQHPLLDKNHTAEPGVFFTTFAARKAFVDEVGKFDPAFKLTYGDTDWEQRANDILSQRGSCLVRADYVRVFHGASVTRKRIGLEAQLAIDTADHQTFLTKWAERPDVCNKHPAEEPDSKRDFLKQEWPRVGEP